MLRTKRHLENIYNLKYKVKYIVKVSNKEEKSASDARQSVSQRW